MKYLILIISLITLLGCDKVNNTSRTIDTMMGGDYRVYVGNRTQPFIIINGKVTSVPYKGYYIFYPTINGKKQLVQSPIASTLIIKTD